MKSLPYIFFLFFIISSFGQGQQVSPIQLQENEEEKKIPLSQLEDTLPLEKIAHFEENFQEKYLSKDYHYEEIPLQNEKDPPKKTKKDRKNTSFDFSWNWLNSLTSDGIASFITWVSVLFLIIILGYFLYLNLSNSTFRSQKIIHRNLKEVENLSEEEIINTSNLNEIDQLILNAKQEHNYRLALRLQFLKVFKKMIEKEIFQFKKDKTNYDYYNEIDSKELKTSFKKIVHWYDYVWYGEYYIDSLLYNKALLEFETILKHLS